MCVCAGAIELSVLSEHYQLELDVVDVQSQRIDRFGMSISNSFPCDIHVHTCSHTCILPTHLYSSVEVL